MLIFMLNQYLVAMETRHWHLHCKLKANISEEHWIFLKHCIFWTLHLYSFLFLQFSSSTITPFSQKRHLVSAFLSFVWLFANFRYQKFIQIFFKSLHSCVSYKYMRKSPANFIMLPWKPSIFMSYVLFYIFFFPLLGNNLQTGGRKKSPRTSSLVQFSIPSGLSGSWNVIQCIRKL